MGWEGGPLALQTKWTQESSNLQYPCEKLDMAACACTQHRHRAEPSASMGDPARLENSRHLTFWCGLHTCMHCTHMHMHMCTHTCQIKQVWRGFGFIGGRTVPYWLFDCKLEVGQCHMEMLQMLALEQGWRPVINVKKHRTNSRHFRGGGTESASTWLEGLAGSAPYTATRNRQVNYRGDRWENRGVHHCSGDWETLERVRARIRDAASISA